MRQAKVEVQVNPDLKYDIEESISCEQIIAGVDTSLEAVQTYIDGIFAQIRVRGRQFMNAFYTPIYRNPVTVLHKIKQKPKKQSIKAK